MAAALTGNLDQVDAALASEEQEERRRDREYRAPLKQELEAIRLSRQREPRN